MGLITFEEAAEALLNYKANGLKTHDHAKRRIEKHLTPAFKGKRLVSITTDLIEKFIVERQTVGASNGEINRELATLKRMFTLAVRARKLHAKPHIPMLAENNVRKRFFEPEQFEAVRRKLPEALGPVVTFAYLTGWRLTSEILPLEWRQVDWNGRTVRLDPGTTKNRDGRTFPFTAAIESLLKSQLAEHDRLKKANRIIPLVFHRNGKRIKDLRKAWKTPATLQTCQDASCTTSDAQRCGTSSVTGCHAPQRWRW